MTNKTISALILSLALLFGNDKNLFSWDLFNFFGDTVPDTIRLSLLENFNPDQDLPWLPDIEGKSMFDAVEDLSILRNDDVRYYIHQYLTIGRPYVIKGIERSAYYLPIINDIFDEMEDSSIPRHLTLLPLLESGFHPRAVSRSGAVGLWQFMYPTGKSLGLQVNREVDERRHIEKSTKAAIAHLKNLYKLFGSWELALAAYNGGGGHVNRALIKSNRPPFWDFIQGDYLFRETREYVPRFLALAAIYRHQHLFGISSEIEHPGLEKTILVNLPNPVSLTELSKATAIPRDILTRYNPHFTRDHTPRSLLNCELRIPERYAENYITGSERLLNPKIRALIPHEVKSGETLGGIAQRYKKKLLTW